MSRILIALIRVWQRGIAPLLGPHCRYIPGCSEYTALAIGKHGSLRGLWKGIRRVLRCHPWGGSGVDYP